MQELRHRNTVITDQQRAPFTAEAPDRVWITDISFIPTRAGSTSPCSLDLYSQAVVGWPRKERPVKVLVLDALTIAGTILRVARYDVERRAFQAKTLSQVDRT